MQMYSSPGVDSHLREMRHVRRNPRHQGVASAIGVSLLLSLFDRILKAPSS